MAKKKYIATQGAPFRKANVQIYGEELNKIASNNSGQLNPEDVIEAAKNTNNPLHEYFDWDDTEAANKYRLFQARNMINHITVSVQYNGSQKEHKAFFSVNSTPEEKAKNRTYITIDRVLNEPVLRGQVIKDALKEIEYWKRKYAEYLELRKIFKAIEETKKKITKKVSIK